MAAFENFSDIGKREAASQKLSLFAICRRPGLDPGLGFLLTNGAEGKPSPVSSTGRRVSGRHP
jgi:hypothetical protein